jgi:hypothetical protein
MTEYIYEGRMCESEMDSTGSGQCLVADFCDSEINLPLP